MNKFNFVMDSFNRDGTMYCCNNDTVATMDIANFKDITTGVICPSDDMINVKNRFEDYVRKDELEDLISKISDSYNCTVSHDDVVDSFRLLYEKLIKGNKKKNENSFLNYEREVTGYELLYEVK